MTIQQLAENALRTEQRGNPAAAIAELESLLTEEPDFLFALLHSARLNLAAGERRKSLSRLRHAASLKQGDVEHDLVMSSLFMMHDCFRESLDCVRRAAKKSPKNPDVWGQMVAVAREGRDTECVREACKALLLLDSRHESAAIMLADLDAQSGDFKSAEAAYRSVLAINPNNSGALAGLSKCRRFGPDDDALSLIDAVDNKALDVAGQARIGFARAKVLNDQKRYEEAWKTAEQANRLKRQISSFDRDRVTQQKELIIDSVDRARNDQRASSSQAEHLLIVGMPRSGTTLVEQILADHPQYYPGGEVPAFERAMAATPNGGGVLRRLADGQPFDLDALAESYEQYFQQFANFSGERIINKVPSNFFYVGLFKLMFPKGKVINVRRNPLDVATSIFFENFGTRFGYTTSLEDIFFFYELYLALIEQWQSRFPDSVLNLDYENLVAAPVESRAALFRFLGAEDHGSEHAQVNNAVETPSLWQARQPIYSSAVNRWRHYEAFLKAYLHYLPAGYDLS